MKKLIYILAALIFAVASCAPESLNEDGNGAQIVDGMLKCEFTVVDPSFNSVTKSLGNPPDIRTMKVVVFDNNGVYLSQSDAELVSAGNGAGTYSAYFPVSDKEEPRIIHFLGNYTETIEYGTELEVISQLTTTNNVDAYWQRKVVPNLKAVNVEGNITLVQEIKVLLDNIVLIRNFCKLTISSANDSNLTISAAAVYNVPTSGTVAPYSSANSSFVVGYDSNAYTHPSDLISAGYSASVPIDCELKVYTDSDELTTATDGAVTLFSYEREEPVDNPPFVLVKGRFNGDDHDTWYRINLRDEDDKYYPLLRNFNYNIQITKVTEAGFSTPEEAIGSIGSGDIFTDIRTTDLPEISNGEAGMRVSATEFVFVDTTPQDLYFQFVPLKNSYYKSDASTWTKVTGNSVIVNDDNNVTITLGPADSSTGAVFESQACVAKATGDETVDGAQWRKITLTPNSPGDVPRVQTVTITGTYSLDGTNEHTKTVSRTIRCVLLPKPRFTLQCLDANKEAKAIQRVKGTPVVVRIGIPAGLPSSIFPLDLSIEAERLTISPDMNHTDNNLPVVSGRSLFDNTKPGFHFIKTLQISDYTNAEAIDGIKYFDIYFKTNIAESATTIRVTNPRFDYAEGIFSNCNKVKNLFDNVSSTYTKSENSATLHFSMENTETVQISLSNGVTISGSGISGGPGVYSYTPTAAGDQNLTLDFGNDVLETDLELSGTNYYTVNTKLYFPYASFGNVTLNGQTLSFNVPTTAQITINLSDGVTITGSTTGNVSGSNGSYTYSPTNAGEQSITLNKNGQTHTTITLEATRYNRFNKTFEFSAGKTIIWENDGSKGEISWSSDYRFSSVNAVTGEEIYAVPMDIWERMKTETFYMTFSGANAQIRVTTGWWSTTWTGDYIFVGNGRITDNGDGTFTLEINLAGDPILDLIDPQHLLFTGQRYTPLQLYY